MEYERDDFGGLGKSVRVTDIGSCKGVSYDLNLDHVSFVSE